MQGIADYVTKTDAFVYKGQAPEEDITKIDQGDVILKGLSDDEAKSLQDAINKSGYQGPKVKAGLYKGSEYPATLVSHRAGLLLNLFICVGLTDFIP